MSDLLPDRWCNLRMDYPGALPVLPPGPTRQQRFRPILLLQARAATLSGDTDHALRDARLLLHESPAPIFDILHGQPGWSDLEGPARLRGERPPATP